MAAERTLLAWIRTSLGLMGFGFVVARFGLFLRELQSVSPNFPGHSTGASLGIGITLVTLGIAMNLMAAWRYARLFAQLARGETAATERWPMGIILAIILALLGMAIVGYLVATIQ
jgi:putative membrane protein